MKSIRWTRAQGPSRLITLASLLHRHGRVPRIVLGVVGARAGKSLTKEDLEFSPHAGWGIHLASGNVVTTTDITMQNATRSTAVTERLQVFSMDRVDARTDFRRWECLVSDDDAEHEMLLVGSETAVVGSF